MNKIILTILFATSFLFSENFAEYKKTQEQEYGQYKKNLEADFKNYKAVYEKELAKFTKDIYSKWGDRTTSSKKKWVEYSTNKKTRKIVDFEKNEIIIEIISTLSPKAVKRELYKEAIKTISASPKTAYQKDTLAKNVDKKFSRIAKTPFLKKNIQDTKPILKNIILPNNSSTTNLIRYISKAKTPVETRKAKNTRAKIYSMKIKLPKYFPQKKAKALKYKVAKNSKKFKIDKALIYAIIHSESGFNPLSTSGIPAYGLMQIVPRSAGIDAYQMVYKKKRILSASYLYDPTNNLEMGSAYLHILYYRYLKRIKNLESRMYCVISAYNTGAGNVSRAFDKGSRKGRLKRAIKVINRMTPKQVYNTLIQKLPHKETQVYLDRVSKRVKIYTSLNY